MFEDRDGLLDMTRLFLTLPLVTTVNVIFHLYIVPGTPRYITHLLFLLLYLFGITYLARLSLPTQFIPLNHSFLLYSFVLRLHTRISTVLLV